VEAVEPQLLIGVCSLRQQSAEPTGLEGTCLSIFIQSYRTYPYLFPNLTGYLCFQGERFRNGGPQTRGSFHSLEVFVVDDDVGTVFVTWARMLSKLKESPHSLQA
jgi:hypothetical protein